jgi:AraC-like DNA-binding protein
LGQNGSRGKRGVYIVYITEIDPSSKALQREACAFLVDAPSLRLSCNEVWRSQGRRPIDVLIQDIFEVKNPGFDEQPYLLLPNGNPSLIFVLNPKTPGCFLCGPLTTARRISVPVEGAIFCIRFVPGSMKWFRTGPASYFADQVEPLSKYMVQAEELLQLLCSIHTYEERCGMAVSFLDYKIRRSFCVEPMIQESVQHIIKCKGRTLVCDVAKTVGRSERYISRVFKDTVGITIKTYCEIVQFTHSLYSIAMMHPDHLYREAHTYGYFDLSHMNRTYKRFLGYTANEIKHLEMDAIYVLDLLCDC